LELILDASSPSARVGLASEGLVHWATPPLAPLEHTRQLLPSMLAGLQATQRSWSDLRLIVVALGPGPFNGLRVAVSTAKGLAIGTGAATVGIPTLLAEAHRCTPAGTVRPVIAAGRSAFAAALYTWRDGDWVQVDEARLVEEDAVAELLQDDALLCGETERIAGRMPRATAGPEPSLAEMHGSRLDSLAALGWQRYVARDITAAAALQPLYARPPHITIPRDRRP